MGVAHVRDEDLLVQQQHLRYGNIAMMADPDDDGSDIKCAMLNIFLHDFEQLCDSTLRFWEYVLPVSKGKKGGNFMPLYKEDDVIDFLQSDHDAEITAYEKGLGSYNTDEAMQYARKPIAEKQLIFDKENTTRERRIAFLPSKGRTEDEQEQKKERASKYQKNTCDMEAKTTNISEVFQTELQRYFYFDSLRSIPSLLDGLTESKRKVVYTVQHELADGETMKTAQLGNKTANSKNYHHDENQLSNNIHPS